MADPRTGEIRKHIPGKNVEYRVREIKRYVVTRHECNVTDHGQAVTGGTRQVGSEYDNAGTAYDVAYALCSVEHEQLGYTPDDPRILYPRDPRIECGQQADPSLVGLAL